jgi:hypothetical protein
MIPARVTSGERHDDSAVTRERHLSDSPGSNDSVMRTADEAFDALYKLFTSPEVRRRAYLRARTHKRAAISGLMPA